MGFNTFGRMKQHIMGPAGQLEILWTMPRIHSGSNAAAVSLTSSRWAVICHPHPLFGGTMHNKVITVLFRTFTALGLGTIRFNFRGVGESEGCFDQATGELDDLWAVIRWLRCNQCVDELWLGGFSFGAYIVARAAGQLLASAAPPDVMVAIKRVVLIAPPVEQFTMHSLAPITCPWIVVQGQKDDIVSPDAVFSWATEQAYPPRILTFPQAGHFFHGELLTLQNRMQKALSA